MKHHCSTAWSSSLSRHFAPSERAPQSTDSFSMALEEPIALLLLLLPNPNPWAQRVPKHSNLWCYQSLTCHFKASSSEKRNCPQCVLALINPPTSYALAAETISIPANWQEASAVEGAAGDPIQLDPSEAKTFPSWTPYRLSRAKKDREEAPNEKMMRRPSNHLNFFCIIW